MFSGKTKELLRSYRAYKAMGLKCILLKPLIDIRYSIIYVSTHGGDVEEAFPVDDECFDTNDFLNHIDQFQVIFIDEAHFFKPSSILKLLARGKTVIAALLNSDYQQQPWPTFVQLSVYADMIVVLHARCEKCNTQPAIFTKRKDDCMETQQILIGGKEIYYPCCFSCLDEFIVQ